MHRVEQIWNRKLKFKRLIITVERIITVVVTIK